MAEEDYCECGRKLIDNNELSEQTCKGCYKLGQLGDEVARLSALWQTSENQAKQYHAQIEALSARLNTPIAELIDVAEVDIQNRTLKAALELALPVLKWQAHLRKPNFSPMPQHVPTDDEVMTVLEMATAIGKVKL